MKSLIPKSKAKTAYGLLSEVRAIIRAEPKRYDQHDLLTIRAEHERNDSTPACGTVACVAGWVTVLKSRRPLDVDQWDYAERKLGLTPNQGLELFRMSAAGFDDRQTPKHAQKGAAHIREFQQKYRARLLAKKV